MAEDTRVTEGQSFGSFWGAHTAAGAVTLGALAFLVAMRRVFRNHNGG